MRMTRIAIAMAALLLTVTGCNETGDVGKDVGATCDSDGECRSNLCVNHTCIKPCTPTSCADGEECSPSGLCKPASCSETKPCADPNEVCKDGVCVEKVAECSETKPCADPNEICKDGVCVEKVAECSETKPCADPNEVCEDGVCVEKAAECSETKPCADPNMICEDGVCVYECTAAKPCADKTKVCVDGKCRSECDDERPCTGEHRVCVEGQCVFRPENACEVGTCEEGMVCGEDGVCFAGECSTIDECAEGLFCQNAKCVSREEVVCYRDADCGEGYGCDQNKCVPSSSCSMTRTCPNNWICHEGTCKAPVSAVCSKTKPCPDEGQTCVENQCVTCHCKASELCVGDGVCVDANTSESGKVTVGDPCAWDSFTRHCDKNRVFSCSEGKVAMTNCGARVCADAPEEGIGCYDSCENEGDFIGECVGWTTSMQFTRVCSTTKDNKRVWSLQKGYEECVTGCTNGRCNYVPDDYGQQCTSSTYPDKCQGDWLSYCYYGYATGTDCTTYSSEHICALPSENAQKMYDEIDETGALIAACVLPCTEPGKTHFECVETPDGSVVSMRYLCATSTTGQLVDFEAGYTQCHVACNVESGLCVDKP